MKRPAEEYNLQQPCITNQPALPHAPQTHTKKQKRYAWLALLALAALPACFLDDCFVEEDELYCDATRPCENTADFCDLVGGPDALRNTCVARPLCTEGCSGPVPICNDTTDLCEACTPGEQGTAQCTAVNTKTPFCADNGTCNPCADSTQCLDSTNPECKTDDGSCNPCQEGNTGNALCVTRNPDEPYCIGGACVECIVDVDNSIDPDDCKDPTKPICQANTCRGCKEDSECPEEGDLAGICNRGRGECVLKSQIVYVDDDSTIANEADACGSAPATNAACLTIARALAIVSSDAAKTTIVVADGNYDEKILTVDSNVLIVGESKIGTVIEPNSDNKNTPGLQATGAIALVLDTITVANAVGAGAEEVDADGIQCSGDATLALFDVTIDNNKDNGLEATNCDVRLNNSTVSGNTGLGLDINGGSLSLLNSTVSGNTGLGLDINGGSLSLLNSTVSGNTGGGISISDSDFTIQNTFILGNGSVSAPFGGVEIKNTEEKNPQIFSFNTVSQNIAPVATAVVGVSCETIPVITAHSNIVFGTNLAILQNVDGTCLWSHSIIQVPRDGVNNITNDPLFVGATTVFERANFKIPTNSPAKDKAIPNATLAKDFEGDNRPPGEADIGADEFTP